MQDSDGKRHSKGGKTMCKERLSTAHCGGANHGCARLQCSLPVRSGITRRRARCAHRRGAPHSGHDRQAKSNCVVYARRDYVRLRKVFTTGILGGNQSIPRGSRRIGKLSQATTFATSFNYCSSVRAAGCTVDSSSGRLQVIAYCLICLSFVVSVKSWPGNYSAL